MTAEDLMRFLQNANQSGGVTTFKKRSGCQTKIAQKGKGAGKRVTYGWKSTKQGLFSYFATLLPPKGLMGGSKTSQSGNKWQGCIVTITNKRTGEVTKRTGGMIIESTSGKVGKVIFGNSFVMNPYAPNGGFIGGVGTKNRSNVIRR